MRTLTTSTSPQFYWALDRRPRYRAQFNRQFLWQNNSGSKCWNGVMRQKNWNHCNYTWEIIIAGFILLISIDCFSFFFSISIHVCKCSYTIANCGQSKQLQMVFRMNGLFWCVCENFRINYQKYTFTHTLKQTLKAIIISHFRREKNVFGERNKKY